MATIEAPRFTRRKALKSTLLIGGGIASGMAGGLVRQVPSEYLPQVLTRDKTVRYGGSLIFTVLGIAGSLGGIEVILRHFDNVQLYKDIKSITDLIDE